MYNKKNIIFPVIISLVFFYIPYLLAANKNLQLANNEMPKNNQSFTKIPTPTSILNTSGIATGSSIPQINAQEITTPPPQYSYNENTDVAMPPPAYQTIFPNRNDAVAPQNSFVYYQRSPEGINYRTNIPNNRNNLYNSRKFNTLIIIYVTAATTIFIIILILWIRDVVSDENT